MIIGAGKIKTTKKGAGIIEIPKQVYYLMLTKQDRKIELII